MALSMTIVWNPGSINGLPGTIGNNGFRVGTGVRVRVAVGVRVAEAVGVGLGVRLAVPVSNAEVGVKGRVACNI